MYGAVAGRLSSDFLKLSSLSQSVKTRSSTSGNVSFLSTSRNKAIVISSKKFFAENLEKSDQECNNSRGKVRALRSVEQLRKPRVAGDCLQAPMTEAKKLALAQRLFFLYFTEHFFEPRKGIARRKTKDERNRQQSLRQSPTQPNVKFSGVNLETFA